MRREPFAVLLRPKVDPEHIEVLLLAHREAARLSDLVMDDDGHGILAVVPFRQIREKDLPAVDDGTPLLRLDIEDRAVFPLEEFLSALPSWDRHPSATRFMPDDRGYGEKVSRVLESEIAEGVGANFVVRRDLVCDVGPFAGGDALALLRSVLLSETGAHWVFVVWTGQEFLIGASPEMHASLEAGVAAMNPISGTLRYGDPDRRVTDLLDFLRDRKEVEELYMVLDEELKMMAQICARPCRVTGPWLRQMSALAHTEYLIEGATDRAPWEVLRGSLPAPTIIGSPLRSACETAARYEPEGRGYYGGVLALLEPRPRGDVLDSTILIRTARVQPGGELRIGVGATVVQESTPEGETAETRVKAEGLLRALTRTAGPDRCGPDSARAHGAGPESLPEVRRALRGRNRDIAPFWLGAATPAPTRRGLRVRVVEAEDDFAYMLARQLEFMGAEVTFELAAAPPRRLDADLVVLGPGPGDPRDRRDPRIRGLRGWIRFLLSERVPFMAICLSHQVVAHELGFELIRLPRPYQGTQRPVDFLGSRFRVAYYNSFVARAPHTPRGRSRFTPLYEAKGRQLVGIVGDGLVTMQFHPESIRTLDGPEILGRCLNHLIGPASGYATAG
jgi:phenazine biosynthesis protein phzE